MQKFDVVIIGAGVVGLGTAYRLLQKSPGISVALLEKDARVAMQQSTHNSGVLHCGLYYKPGSQKAQLSVSGLRQMVEFCQEHHIAHEVCGKIVVATEPEELPRLDELERRGKLNGLVGVRRLDPAGLREIEPHANGLAALHVPQEGIVDYRGVADALAKEIERLGGVVCVKTRVIKMMPEIGSQTIITSSGDFVAKRVINCGGLHSDRLAAMSGGEEEARIVPFRGEYFKLRPERQSLVKHLIYPVPDPSFPFLGVHFTRLIHGGIEAGPNAILATAREGYRKRDIHLGDLAEQLTYAGLWKFIAKYPKTTFFEVWRSLNKQVFCRSLQKLVPDVRVEDLVPGGAGVRAQAMRRDGSLVDDFVFQQRNGVLNVINAPSPAATASLAIGQRIVEELATLG